MGNKEIVFTFDFHGKQTDDLPIEKFQVKQQEIQKLLFCKV